MAKANQLITDEAGVMIQRAGFCKGQWVVLLTCSLPCLYFKTQRPCVEFMFWFLLHQN
jgi:hypothetical protein